MDLRTLILENFRYEENRPPHLLLRVRGGRVQLYTNYAHYTEKPVDRLADEFNSAAGRSTPGLSVSASGSFLNFTLSDKLLLQLLREISRPSDRECNTAPLPDEAPAAYYAFLLRQLAEYRPAALPDSNPSDAVPPFFSDLALLTLYLYCTPEARNFLLPPLLRGISDALSGTVFSAFSPETKTLWRAAAAVLEKAIE